ncbi:hypothetical protein B0A58_11625 [Flavobacterium branchiophilum NBRC 15030 = ATCC 35035]|uniref:DUF4157 domain-containing protein n=1 Tax=Flavobacterium branchiophilum TaxID=55197 RepID=A0A543G5U2_9FLAO|nr:hypothetical protein [Flavobacterium branchiophilum]OXA73566.1 hypothetical protein B0A58_11625 [Flavobacterium branchiophilum NBRC 15030 = ATCC 35035]TQM41453.1 hypothetical protein BC670_2418 [Flavobacterium branchiophilum]GEM55341.1 hypothetical protein FB1_15620 [Flavobacterium branchiophilum NBRC 15030 = ATCC 35035]
MLLLISKYFVPKGYVGITIFPFVFLKNKQLKNNKCLINHEKIHLKQQLELLIIPFFIWYLIDFFIQYYRFKNKNAAYRNIVFEKEAYANEQNLNYLTERKMYDFLKYINK